MGCLAASPAPTCVSVPLRRLLAGPVDPSAGQLVKSSHSPETSWEPSGMQASPQWIMAGAWLAVGPGWQLAVDCWQLVPIRGMTQRWTSPPCPTFTTGNKQSPAG